MLPCLILLQKTCLIEKCMQLASLLSGPTTITYTLYFCRMTAHNHVNLAAKEPYYCFLKHTTAVVDLFCVVNNAYIRMQLSNKLLKAALLPALYARNFQCHGLKVNDLKEGLSF